MLDKKGKGESIQYAIRKKLCVISFSDWCESWEFTIEEVERFLELGAKAFDEESTEICREFTIEEFERLLELWAKAGEESTEIVIKRAIENVSTEV